MQILGFLAFLLVSHFLLMQIFRFSTYHAFFWKVSPVLVIYGAAVAWSLFKLGMHPFFLWQLVLASAWLFVVGRKNTKSAQAILTLAGDDADYVRLMAESSTQTSRYYAYSSFIYVFSFAAMYLWLYNI